MVNVEGFIHICQPNKDDLYDWLKTELGGIYGDKLVAQNGYIFCQGSSPVGLSAHLDTVFKQSPITINNANGFISSPQGIGGDDRCGIYATLDILMYMKKNGKLPFIFLSTDEEVGGSTTKKMAKECADFVADLRFIIALDRAGSVDSVYYECDNRDFKKWIDAFGFKEAQGTRTDICTLCDEWDVAGVNFSVGYYKNHSKDEYVVIHDLENTIEKCHKIVDAADPERKFPFCKRASFGKYYQNYSFDEPFLKGDHVFTKSYEVTGYFYPRASGSSCIRIPPYTSLVVLETESGYCKVRYKDTTCWVSNYNLLMDVQ